ncbi:MAG: hypothetical protein NUK63_01865 [Candidatus Bathyarchaeum tardum]|nr:MAG: hypothetical protein NUK63_01865 [Candidatus Bathyarchaeum tardum]
METNSSSDLEPSSLFYKDFFLNEFLENKATTEITRNGGKSIHEEKSGTACTVTGSINGKISMSTTSQGSHLEGHLLLLTPPTPQQQQKFPLKNTRSR